MRDFVQEGEEPGSANVGTAGHGRRFGAARAGKSPDDWNVLAVSSALREKVCDSRARLRV